MRILLAELKREEQTELGPQPNPFDLLDQISAKRR
jgi:hypothetical protein